LNFSIPVGAGKKQSLLYIAQVDIYFVHHYSFLSIFIGPLAGGIWREKSSGAEPCWDTLRNFPQV